MPPLILPTRFTQQPQAPVQVDRSGIGNGLVSFLAPTEAPSFYDYVSGQFASDPYTPGDQSFKYTGIKKEGRWRNTGGGSYRNNAKIFGNLQQFTIVHLVRPLALVGTGTSLLGYAYSSSGYRLGDLQLGNGTNNRLVVGTTLGGGGQLVSDVDYTVGTFYAVAYTSNFITGVQNLFINGQKQSGIGTYSVSSAVTNFTLASDSSSIYISADRAYVEYYGTLVFSRVLSNNEVVSLSTNPYQLLAAKPRRIWVAAASAGAALQAISTAQTTSVANLTTQIAIAASAMAQTSATAALATSISLGANASASATSAAALATQIKLSANTSTLASSSAALTTVAGLAAAVVANASLSASLTTGIALAAIAGASASSATSLITAIRMASAAIAQASVTAALTAPGAALSASAVAITSASAAISTQIRMSAQAQASAAAVTTLTTQILLAAQAQASMRSTAVLASNAVLIASPQNVYVGLPRVRDITGQQRIRVL